MREGGNTLQKKKKKYHGKYVRYDDTNEGFGVYDLKKRKYIYV